MNLKVSPEGEGFGPIARTMNFESSNKVLPQGATYSEFQAGVNGPGFQVHILPYLEDQALFNLVEQAVDRFKRANPSSDFDYGYGGTGEPSPLADAKVSIYQCPSDGEPFATAEFAGGAGRPGASYAGVMGSAIARATYLDGASAEFGGICKGSGGTYDCAGSGGLGTSTVNSDGVLFPMSKVKIGQVVDGTSKTYMLGERWYIMRLWGQGTYGALSGPGKPFASEVWSCKNINPRVPINGKLERIGWYAIHQASDRPGPPTGSTVRFGSPQLPFGSFHPGGANFAYVDGSVHYETDDIDPALYIARGSRNGGETGQEPLRVPVTF